MSRSQNDDLYELRQRYDIKETIGSGGFGKVKRAIHLPTGETVAIKVWNNAYEIFTAYAPTRLTEFKVTILFR